MDPFMRIAGSGRRTCTGYCDKHTANCDGTKHGAVPWLAANSVKFYLVWRPRADPADTKTAVQSMQARTGRADQSLFDIPDTVAVNLAQAGKSVQGQVMCFTTGSQCYTGKVDYFGD